MAHGVANGEGGPGVSGELVGAAVDGSAHVVTRGRVVGVHRAAELMELLDDRRRDVSGVHVDDVGGHELGDAGDRALEYSVGHPPA
jgi:hypothetical protein